LKRASEIIDAFKGQNVLVIGDIMMDCYQSGKINRISPEAPVPVLDLASVENRLGGAGNVALNLKDLGAHPFLVSVIGDDIRGEELLGLLSLHGLNDTGIIKDKQRRTTVKTRFIAQHQQLLRVDSEDVFQVSQNIQQQLLERVILLCSEQTISAIVFEDYDKGVLSPDLIHRITNFAREKNILTTVDPKKRNFQSYHQVDLFKPNLREVKEGLNMEVKAISPDSLCSVHESLTALLSNKITLITLSEHGVFIAGKNGSDLIPAHKRNIADVSGAGDSVISVATLCLAAGCSLHEIAAMANLAGGIVCEKPGVSTISAAELQKEAERLNVL
jgi:D-glycero-beta-D-manno-heptose-7-phosphate kinase